MTAPEESPLRKQRWKNRYSRTICTVATTTIAISGGQLVEYWNLNWECKKEERLAARRWRGRSEDEILGSMPRVDVHRTRAEIGRDYAGRGDFTLDLELGRETDREARINRRVLS